MKKSEQLLNTMHFCFLILFIWGAHCDPLHDMLAVDGGNAYNGLSSIQTENVSNALDFSQRSVQYTNDHDQSLFNVGVYLDPNTAGFGRFNDAKLNQKYIDANTVSNIICKGMEILSEGNCDKYSLSSKNFAKLLQKKKFRVLGICNVIEVDAEKASSEAILKYRTIDGSYNNLNNPEWGQTGSIYPRILDPDYADGIAAPRVAKSGEKLPSARTVSTKSFPANVKPDSNLSMAASELIQVSSHDLTLQTMDNNLDTGPIACCSKNQACVLPKILQHHSCYPVEVSANDPFFSQYKIGCLNFVRSIAAPKSDCTLSWREQVNTVTGFLDASIVYGYNDSISASLRTFENGLLKESESGKRHLPACSGNSSAYCYKAGDSRVNQQVHLASTQTMYLREHNRLATALQGINPEWDDEKIFQEARRIVIAEHQHYVFKELLPLFFGSSFTTKIFGKSDKNGFTNVYNASVNGACHNDFTIAYRILHAIIPNDIRLCDEARKILSSHKFSDMIGNMTLMEVTSHGFDDVLRGMAASSMMQVKNKVTSEITNKMFKGKNPYGTDLMMLDVQRGRDHGVPGYNAYREYCGLKKVDTFDQLSNNMSSKRIAILKDLYAHPDDIDLVVGGLFERPMNGSKFGPVMHYILQEQFYRTMVGDRFFYTNKNQTYPFTAKQLNEILKLSFAGLICRNSDKIISMPPSAFLIESSKNQRISCKKFADIDLSYWKE